MTTAITTTEPRPLWTPEQEQIILQTFLGGASREEATALLEVARVRRLCPFRRQIFFVQRYDRERGKIWSFQVSIDGLRAKADESGVYAGQDEIETTVDERGRPVASRCVVWRTDRPRGFVGVARWEEFAQTKDGRPVALWASKPFLMLEKCAEALALRRAFPELGGAYTEDEMPAAEHHEPPRQGPRLVAAQHLRPAVLEAIAPPPSAPETVDVPPSQEAELIRQLFEDAVPGSPEWAEAKAHRAKAAKAGTITQREHQELGDLARRLAEEHAAKAAPPAEPAHDSGETYRAIEAAYRGATTRAHLAEADTLCSRALDDGAVSRAQGVALVAHRKVAESRIEKDQPAREPGED